MEYIKFLIDFILHIDLHMQEMVAQYGIWVYAILFLILFCETGLVVTPFLPGDSLLFVAGTLAALPTNDLNIHIMVLLMIRRRLSVMQLTIRSATFSGSGFSAIRTRKFSVRAICARPMRSLKLMAVKRLFWRDLFRL